MLHISQLIGSKYHTTLLSGVLGPCTRVQPGGSELTFGCAVAPGCAVVSGFLVVAEHHLGHLGSSQREEDSLARKGLALAGAPEALWSPGSVARPKTPGASRAKAVGAPGAARLGAPRATATAATRSPRRLRRAPRGRAVPPSGPTGEDEEGVGEGVGEARGGGRRDAREPRGGRGTRRLQRCPKAFELTAVATPAASFTDISSGVTAPLQVSREAELVLDSAVDRPCPPGPVMSSFRCEVRDMRLPWNTEESPGFPSSCLLREA